MFDFYPIQLDNQINNQLLLVDFVKKTKNFY